MGVVLKCMLVSVLAPCGVFCVVICLDSTLQDGWNQTHFITPVSTLERDRYRSQPTLPTSTLQMSPVMQTGEYVLPHL